MEILKSVKNKLKSFWNPHNWLFNTLVLNCRNQTSYSYIETNSLSMYFLLFHLRKFELKSVTTSWQVNFPRLSIQQSTAAHIYKRFPLSLCARRCSTRSKSHAAGFDFGQNFTSLNPLWGRELITILIGCPGSASRCCQWGKMLLKTPRESERSLGWCTA